MGELYDQSVFNQKKPDPQAQAQAAGQRWLSLIALVLFGLVVVGLAVWQYTHNPDKMIVNINKASVEELGYLPGVGPEIAEKIVQGRPYNSPEEIKKVPGIGDKTFEKMRARVKVE